MNFRVAIPSPLRSYCDGARVVTVDCGVVAPRLSDLLASLDASYPGIRFRMVDEQGKLRPHIKIFVDAAVERDPATLLPPDAEVMIVAALSGG
ncbi:MAG TPA: MoaD/ThiS family protein [Casimicrobiaceae bacterium]|nr:MoaD/ThiS family protein [Casimicrobiaceae bacterium]